MAEAILTIGLIVFVAHYFVALFKKTRLPDVLLLVILGVILGPVTHFVQPEAFGRAGHVVSTIALIVILFESGITMDPQVIPRIWKPTMRLTFISFGVTVGITTAVSIYWLGLPTLMASMLGVILGGTSAAVVIALVKTMQMKDPAGTILIMESALGDVLCIILLIGLMEAHRSGQVAPGKMVGTLLASLIIAALVGVLGGVAWLSMLNVIRRSPNSAFTTLAFVFVLYGITDLLGFSGAITALAFGATLTNHRFLPIHHFSPLKGRELGMLTDFDHVFFNEILFLLKVFFFIFLGVSIQFSEQWMILVACGLVLMIYFARLFIVKVTAAVTTISWEEAGLMSALAPKGLVAAVLASIPLAGAIPGAERARDFTYLVVLISVIITSALIPLIRQRPLSGFYRRLYGGPGDRLAEGQKPPMTLGEALREPAPEVADSKG